MKKIYMQPNLKWVETETEEMMVIASQMEKGFDLGSTEYTTDETSGNLSREDFSVWNDEE